VLEKTNSIAIAGISRFKLIDESTPMPDDAGIAIRDRFYDALRAYKASSHTGDSRYLVDPEHLMSSIHA
jgi:hypothetical protein